MTSLPSAAPVGPAKSQPNVYTALLLVAVIALAVAVGVALYTLMGPMPKGYGMQFGDLFGPLKDLK